MTARAWPRKAREMHNHHMDSTRWNDLAFRDDDVVIATWGKSGTTWTQQIVGQLIHNGDPDIAAGVLAPWIEFRPMPWSLIREEVEAQTHRRMMKTHLPVDALVISPKAKYIYIGRDPRDVVWSMHNHHMGFRPEVYDMFNKGVPGPEVEPFLPPDPDIRAYYNDWLDRDGGAFWPFWAHVQSWWDVRDLPNVLLTHFAGLKADPEGEIRRIAAFLDIEIDPAVWPAILEHCSFDYMKANAAKTVPMAEHVFEGGARTFINKGENGRWRDVLSPFEIKRCDEIAAARLSPECAHWLNTGEMLATETPR